MRTVVAHCVPPTASGRFLMECMPTPNTNSSTVTVMIVSDRAEAWSVSKKMFKCPFAWLYGHYVSLGYSDSMVRSLMEGLEPNTYFMARETITYNQETLESEVEFNENQSENWMMIASLRTLVGFRMSS